MSWPDRRPDKGARWAEWWLINWPSHTRTTVIWTQAFTVVGVMRHDNHSTGSDLGRRWALEPESNEDENIIIQIRQRKFIQESSYSYLSEIMITWNWKSIKFHPDELRVQIRLSQLGLFREKGWNSRDRCWRAELTKTWGVRVRWANYSGLEKRILSCVSTWDCSKCAEYG